MQCAVIKAGLGGRSAVICELPHAAVAPTGGALTITTYISLIVSWVSRKRGHSLLLLFCYVMWCDTYISIFLIAYKLMRVFYNKIIYSTVQPTGWWPKHRLYLSPQPFHTAQYCIYLLLYFQYFCLFCHMIISFWEAPLLRFRASKLEYLKPL